MITLLLILTFLAFAFRRTLSYLHIFQQEEYDSPRFIKWLTTSRAFDKKLSLAIIVLSVLAFIPAISDIVPVLLAPVFLFFAHREQNPLRQGKKPLVLTNRAKRIFGLSILLTFALTCAIVYFIPTLFVWLLPVQALPLALCLATTLWQPYEASNNARYRAEAVRKLDQINPYIVAVTGSFGKTSVKHILNHILQNFAPTLITPGSVNTELGIVRIVREQLQPHHKYFIVEMGAYGIGSIARLCKLTPPKLAVITAIGAAHYERFKTLDDTARAKFEIAEAAIKEGGKVAISESVLDQPYAKEFYIREQDKFITCGPSGDLKVISAKHGNTGLIINLEWKQKTYTAMVPLFGLHHVGNIMLAFIVAAELGMDPADIIMSLLSMPQIKHRLEVKPSGNHTLIDDAYNSNPTGFMMALDVLDVLGKTGRRILVTPGMVELGEQHDSEHAKIGAAAAEKTDITILVKPARIESFKTAFVQKMNPSGPQLIEVQSFQEAQAWLQQNIIANDVVLLENDLPDLYEKKFVS